ncbi:MAG TPA: Gfo/Idh/MocA family oxidoreductase [Steroidobacteraceae bacterium]
MNAALAPAQRIPRIGFLGVGWIGSHRLQAVAESGVAQVVAIADASPETARSARGRIQAQAPEARVMADLASLLNADLDGVVIATPSGMHAVQSIAALERGLAVFCQKPLARTAHEARTVIDVARRKQRLLEVDFCYRNVAGVAQLAQLARQGALGEIYAVDLTFHNAYGPDKTWFYDPLQSGGGCVMDLGVHLVDLALWVLGFPQVAAVSSRLYAGGQRLSPALEAIEDYAVAEIVLLNHCVIRLACSWRLPAGREAVIDASFYGTRGAASLRNVNGSFYDFTVEHHEGTRSHALSMPPDAWGGRTICAWARRLGEGCGFDPAAEHFADVSAVIDAIYQR